MPFIDISKSAVVPTFYNVVHAVGNRCPNQPNDVKLVQMLLGVIYEPPAGELKADGFCGPKTKGFIRRFQLDLRASGLSTSVDECVDRARNGETTGSISHTRYTIVSLNEIAKTVNPAAWAAIRSAVPMTRADAVPPPSGDRIDQAPVQSTQPRDFGRTRTSPAVQSSSPK